MATTSRAKASAKDCAQAVKQASKASGSISIKTRRKVSCEGIPLARLRKVRSQLSLLREFSSCQWHELFQRAIDAKPSEQSDGQVHHLNRFRYDKSAPPESRQPVAQTAIDLLQSPSLVLALVMLPYRQALLIAYITIRTIQPHRPGFQTLQERVEGALITIPTLPIDQLSGVPAESEPDPELVVLVSNEMPDLINLHHDHPSRTWRRLCRPFLSTLADPSQDRGRDNGLQKGDSLQRESAQVEQDGLGSRLVSLTILLNLIALQAGLPPTFLAFPFRYAAC